MLDRYRKSGGFNQLLGLLETCGPTKQEKFLQIIRDQDGLWAEALESRILTVTRIFSWPEVTVAELLPGLAELTIATAMHAMSVEQREIFCRTMSFAQKRGVSELFQSGKPSAPEIGASVQKLLLEARRLISTGRLRLHEFDPELTVPDDIEERLKKGSRSFQPLYNHGAASRDAKFAAEQDVAVEIDIGAHVSGVMAATVQAEATSKLEASLREENMVLRRKLSLVSNENGALKQDIVRLQMKIEQIRKMAA